MPDAEPTPFGAELKAHRVARGWTQADLAGALGWSASFVSDVERGERNPRSDFSAKCDEVFGLPGTFGRILDGMRSKAFPAYFTPVLHLEQDAVRIHEWAASAVPGLLQTAEYARSVIRAGAPNDDDEAVERKVEARRERQEVLSREKSPMYWAVIHEGVLRHVIGSPEIMAGQLDKLIKAAETPGIVIQVLPFTAHDHAGVEGPISVYEQAGAPTIGYTECHRGGRTVEHPEEVADLMTVVQMLRAVALPPRDSSALMRKIRRDLDGLEEVELQRFVGGELRRDRQR